LTKEGKTMSELGIGMPAPDFTLPATGGTTVSLGAHRGKKIILFFYPKDNTAG
jgi:peroxiredoxin Q/BCP